MARICKSRGCRWPVPQTDDICEECAMNGTPAQQRRDAAEKPASSPSAGEEKK